MHVGSTKQPIGSIVDTDKNKLMKYKDIEGMVAAMKGTTRQGARKNPVKQMMPAGIYTAAFSAAFRHSEEANFDGMELKFSAVADESQLQVANWTGRFGFDSKGRPACQLFPMDGEAVVTKYSVQISFEIK